MFDAFVVFRLPVTQLFQLLITIGNFHKMGSENGSNISLFSTAKEDEQPFSDHNSTMSGNNESALIIEIDSNDEKMNMDVEFPIQTKNDSEVIYISDHEYDSDYEYRRKTKRPGPKSKTRYKLSQAEKNKVTARYGVKKSKLDRKLADKEEKNTNVCVSSIKVEIINDPSDFFAKEKARGIVHQGENISDQLSNCKKDIFSVGNSNQIDKYDNKKDDNLAQMVENTKPNFEKTLVTENENIDKEVSSTHCGINIDSNADLKKIVEGNSLDTFLMEEKVVKVSTSTSLDADSCLEADFKKSAIEEDKKQN